MIRIAVVDDEEKEISIISQIVNDFFNENKLKYNLKTFTSGEALLADKIEFDLIFLDIQMGGIDGIETAKQIRDINKKISLIYISNYTEKMAASFAVHPFAFLEKPIDAMNVKKHIMDYIEYYEEMTKTGSILLTEKNGEFLIDIQEILYFEYVGNRKIKMKLNDSSRIIIDSLSDLENKLSRYDFMIPHKSFLVNKAKIRSFYFSLIMINGDEIPIAKNRHKQIKEEMNDYLHKHLVD